MRRTSHCSTLLKQVPLTLGILTVTVVVDVDTTVVVATEVVVTTDVAVVVVVLKAVWTVVW
jgi:hypothetical protein